MINIKKILAIITAVVGVLLLLTALNLKNIKFGSYILLEDDRGKPFWQNVNSAQLESEEDFTDFYSPRRIKYSQNIKYLSELEELTLCADLTTGKNYDLSLLKSINNLKDLTLIFKFDKAEDLTQTFSTLPSMPSVKSLTLSENGYGLDKAVLPKEVYADLTYKFKNISEFDTGYWRAFEDLNFLKEFKNLENLTLAPSQYNNDCSALLELENLKTLTAPQGFLTEELKQEFEQNGIEIIE